MGRTKSSYVKGFYREQNLVGKLKIYMIAAEGSEKERKYFEEMIERYREIYEKNNLSVKFLSRPEKERSHAYPTQVFQTLTRFVDDNPSRVRDYDELWTVIDIDEPERKSAILEVVNACKQKPYYYLAISNPCIETWLILHFEPFPEKLVEKLNKVEQKARPKICKKYFNDIQRKAKVPHLYKGLVDLTLDAIIHAKEIEQNEDDYPEYYCSRVYKLVEKLIIEAQGQQ